MYHHYFPYPYYPPLYHPYPIDQRQPIYPSYGAESNFYSYPGQQELGEFYNDNFEHYSSEEERQDSGNRPYVVNIESAADRNRAFRRAIWTGRHLQVTLMSIRPGEDIGLENHRDTDQFIRIEEGRGVIQMGDRRDFLNFERRVSEDDAIMIPAGKWHNLINTGRGPLKLYSIYAPPEHPRGTVHRTKQDAMHAHRNEEE